MKVVQRLYLAMAAALLLVIVPFAVYSYQREVRQFQTDMQRDGKLLGDFAAAVVAEAATRDGAAEVRALLAGVSSGEAGVSVRWVSLDSLAHGADGMPLAADSLARRLVSGSVAVVSGPPGRAAAMLTYVPVPAAAAGEASAIEVAEAMSPLFDYSRASIWRLAELSVLLLVAAAAVVGVTGWWLLDRPIRELCRHARRLGAGQLHARLELTTRDELAQLAASMNRMALELDNSRRELVAENQRRIQALEQLRHAERLTTVGRLAAGVAHELGTPLNVVSGRAQLIASGELLAAETEESARTIIRQVDRVSRTIRQLLDFARARPADRQPVDVAELLSSVARLLEPMARKSSVQVEVHSPEALPRAAADPFQLEQVLLNLSMNGIQAMVSGGTLALEAAACTRAAPGGGPDRLWVALVVRDRGAGIERDNLPHIFDPFFTTKEVGQGTGLGLSISYGIIQEHDGWIDVESEVGQGSCFTVYVPAQGAA